jgi:hypothetical protein
MTEPTREPGLTWRDPVLWLVIGPPLAAVIGGLVTVWIAASHRDPLVSETVQKVGVTWQDPAEAPATDAPSAAAPPSAAPRAAEASDDDGG